MTFDFDLISDLHIETWDDFNWTDQPTSPYCVVAGDVCRNLDILEDTLTHLGRCYAGVFYIDGNEEHRHSLENIGNSYQELTNTVKKIKNVVYMQDNVVIINGVAILATNGWWSYDFDPDISMTESQEWYEDYVHVTNSASSAINGIAYHDATYLMNSVRKLQTHQEVKSIVLISHTLPAPWIVSHDLDLANTPRFNCMGNQHLQLAINEDTENKIKTWCFGHYHKPVDQDFCGIRYVSNPRGRGDTPWKQSPYYPKRISIEL